MLYLPGSQLQWRCAPVTDPSYNASLHLCPPAKALDVKGCKMPLMGSVPGLQGVYSALQLFRIDVMLTSALCGYRHTTLPQIS